MAGAFNNLLRMTVAGLASTDFQLEDFRYESQPTVSPGIGRSATHIVVEGTGYLEAANASAFATGLTAIRTALESSGSNVQIIGLADAVIIDLPAATCLNGGPHLGCTMLEQLPDAPLRRRFSFTVEADKLGSGEVGGDPGDPSNSGFKDRTARTPDNLLTATRTGTSSGAIASQIFLTTILPEFRSTHPASAWVVSHEYETDEQDKTVTWSITAKELIEPYPVAAGGAVIVDGEATIDKSRDEQKRLTQIFQFDLLLEGSDPQPVLDQIRAEALAIGPIIRETSRVTRFQQLRLQASFEVLLGAEGNDLLNYTQDFEITDATTTWMEVRFPGADPVLVIAPTGTRILTQSGSATSRGDPFRPPDPLYPDSPLAPWRVTYSAVNDFEIVTRWAYVMEADGFSPFEPPPGMLNQLFRPAAPQFWTTPGGDE